VVLEWLLWFVIALSWWCHSTLASVSVLESKSSSDLYRRRPFSYFVQYAIPFRVTSGYSLIINTSVRYPRPFHWSRVLDSRSKLYLQHTGAHEECIRRHFHGTFSACEYLGSRAYHTQGMVSRGLWATYSRALSARRLLSKVVSPSDREDGKAGRLAGLFLANSWASHRKWPCLQLFLGRQWLVAIHLDHATKDIIISRFLLPSQSRTRNQALALCFILSSTVQLRRLQCALFTCLLYIGLTLL